METAKVVETESFKGKVKFFNNKKSYGFITGVDGKDYFVHYTGILMEGYKTLKENQEVSFSVLNTPKGAQAINVKNIS